ncbi:hypothetical protein F5Y00DRAFT_236751 [Daldinia vernicosa]|uniref:uncharacterized protein n=1 Tax=Daldinia vernicosa TaxID=114800 RepID=UPI002008CDCF|nr:uncharacterized protein F5Y00DRAFT_236751 [Daldinia vernicosa]KAI0848846.1 hypothetical protein F5Y00DRAFT_236751 [Daldinia vernicosa]
MAKGSKAPPPPKQRTRCWWCVPSQELQGRDGWFKNPRDTTFTIDSKINGKNKPSGYDSNSLIMILRVSQALIAIVVFCLYVCTYSVPVVWHNYYTAGLVFLSVFWSIFALFLRHIWSILLAILEIVMAVGWIVLFAITSLSTPDESKEVTFHLSLMVIEVSMVAWFPTFLLAITPFFHWLMPCLFQVQSRRDVDLNAGGAQEMVRLARVIDNIVVANNE